MQTTESSVFMRFFCFQRMESAENMKVQGRKSGGHLKRNSLHEETFGWSNLGVLWICFTELCWGLRTCVIFPTKRMQYEISPDFIIQIFMRLVLVSTLNSHRLLEMLASARTGCKNHFVFNWLTYAIEMLCVS